LSGEEDHRVNSINPERQFTAVNDFYRARNQGVLREIIARFTGKSTELLSYEEVRQKLKAYAGVEKGLRDIPLDAIVGSVGRYSDFTRDFLPRVNVDKDRWSRIKMAAYDAGGLPPIEVYQLGDVYFVIDGNHRVSVARQLGAKTIQAYVTEVRSRVTLTPDIQPDDLIIKAEYVEFLDHTRLDLLRPESRLEVSTPGKYPILEQHINVHHYYLEQEQATELPYQYAVQDWYDNVYTPVVQAIRDSGILHYFPQRTETDLYLWISRYRQELEDQLGWHIRPESALMELTARTITDKKNILSRVGERLLESITPSTLEAGPETGQWRRQNVTARQENQLFLDVLVPLDGKDGGWHALSQAIEIARRENAQLSGLHIVADEDQIHEPESEAIRTEFDRRCSEQNIPGHLAVEAGDITRLITSRASLTDLVVTSLTYPPGTQPLARLDSGFRELIQRCPRPVLAVPHVSKPLDSALLAYDGSPEADEALFIAAYMAAKWKLALNVITVFEGEKVEPETLMRASVYLEEQQVTASYNAHNGPIAKTILDVAENTQVDMIIMGSYSLNPILEVVFGSTVDHVLRASHIPVLICR